MRVLVCGGGIAGLTLALCLRERGHEALVVERAPRRRDEGYMIDFFGSGYDAAERLGLLPELEAIHYPIARLTFLREDGSERFSVSYPAIRKLFDDRHFNFMRGDLECVLDERLGGRVPIRYATTVDAFEDDAAGLRVRLSDGREEHADLLVGADGLHSRVRRLAFDGGADCERFLGYYTAAFIIPGGLDGVRDDAFVTLTTPGRQVAVYPIRGGRTATFFVFEATRADADGRAPAERLRAVFGDLGAFVPGVPAAADRADDIFFDEVSQVVCPAWHRGRVALVGDACQAVSLLAGQGASMAVAGAYILAEELDRGGEVGAALARYERRLKPAIQEKQAAGRRMARWFVPATRLHLGIRDLALRATSWPLASRLVKRQFAADSVFRD